MGEPVQEQPGSGTLLLSPQPGFAAELRPLLAQHSAILPVREVAAYPSRQALADMMAGSRPAVCILDVSADRERALGLAADLIPFQPDTQTVAVLSGNDPDLILRCLRQGANEFLIRPVTADQLRTALDRVLGLRPSGTTLQGTGAKIIAVVPAKGACGATTVACNLAAQWKRLTGKRILLADMDPLTGTVSFVLKLKSAYSFIDALIRAGSLDHDLWKNLVTPSAGVDVLLSPESRVDPAGELQDPTTLIEYTRTCYDGVVVDTGGPYGEWSLSIARSADQILLVSTNELPAVQSAQRSIAYLDRNNVDHSRLHLVVNRYNRDAGLSKDVIETALHMPVHHILPSDYEPMQRALIDGKVISSGSAFGKSLIALASSVGGHNDGPAPAAKKSGSPLSGLLSLFGGKKKK
jgi:pilus assembly protein CpaE